MTPPEWAVIIAEGKKRSEHERDRERKQASLIARDAPEFPVNATWLNGKPLALKELVGKVIIIDFSAEWCGPCRNDLAALAALHKKQPKDVVVIGVHPPGGDPAAIRKVMKELGLEYPICIDVAPPQGVTAWGALYEALGVNRIPHAVVIDGRGKIAATGALGDVLGNASELAGRPL
jgi:thiol-disulfide isomerase/thioredoxin